jgi:2-oxoglutarate ferredoxin oxidoreductase subunit gamma
MEKTGDRFEIRLAGAGGQGMILAGLILAEAAAIYDDKNAIQTQSYGPEARGGASGSEVVISEDRIHYPKVMAPDVLLAMSQEACDKFFYSLKPEGLLIVDAGFVERVPTSRAIVLPITEIAREATGRAITANIVALGLIGGLTGIISREALEKAVSAHVPKGTTELNLRAVAAGWEKAEELLGEMEEPTTAQTAPGAR